MDRIMVYPGGIPLDTDILATNRNTMIALGNLAQMILGSNPVVDGLKCAPTVPASMSVTVSPGSLAQLSVVDVLPYGSLPADTNDPLVKIGINLSPTTFLLIPPTTPGQSMNYLIEGAFQESDAAPIVLPYYNASNPAQPYSGPTNSGLPQATRRTQQVQLQVKAGVPSTTGTQVSPSPDSGWVPLYGVTVYTDRSQLIKLQYRRRSTLRLCNGSCLHFGRASGLVSKVSHPTARSRCPRA